MWVNHQLQNQWALNFEQAMKYQARYTLRAPKVKFSSNIFADFNSSKCYCGHEVVKILNACMDKSGFVQQ